MCPEEMEVTQVGLQPLCRADGPLCKPLPPLCLRKQPSSCLPLAVQPPPTQTKPWVSFLPSRDLGFFFFPLYSSWPVERELWSERKPAPLGIQGGCLRCMGGCFPAPGEAESWGSAVSTETERSPAVPELALLQDAAVGFSASWDLLPLRARAPGPTSSPCGNHCSRTGWPENTQHVWCPVPLPSPAPRAALLCPPSYLRGVF